MKKIAFIVAVPGSASAFLYDHFRQLISRYEVHLLANFPDDESKKLFTEIGVRCHSFPIQRKISVFNDLKALFALRKIFKSERYASVHSVTPKAGLLTALASRWVGVPCRIHIYTGQVWATRNGIMRRLLKFMDTLPAKLNTHLLVDGHSQRQFLIKEGVLTEQNSRVLANGSICGVKLGVFTMTSEIELRPGDILRAV